MNMDSSMSASSDRAADWNQINWPKSERQVRRLQARIVKSTRHTTVVKPAPLVRGFVSA